ncbi:CDP-glycerol glycerophosphotransferase family protein [Halomonas sp. V046]|uniref:CDP-glycerol glycerophosphotransferase family protein n=1 Tax=Halomonas sp. V046 TaxID=3459611 RepID=UPI0040445F1F
MKKKDVVVLTSSLNCEFSDNSRALFQYLYERTEYAGSVYFVLNDKELREKWEAVYPGCFISSFKLADAILILRAKYWFCSALELPIPGLFQRYQREVYHLGHGMLYKKVGLMETKVTWYKKLYYFFLTSNFSYSIATTKFFVPYVSRGFGIPEERVKLLPQPKTGLVFEPNLLHDTFLLDKSNFNILYAPTWRPYSEVRLFPFEDFDFSRFSAYLKEKNVHIWLRVHPRFEQSIEAKYLESSNIHLFSGREFVEINRYLWYFDALISDYSSIYFDYLVLSRPVFFFDYDLDEYCENVGLIEEYESIKCSETIGSLSAFLWEVDCIVDGRFDDSRVKNINSICNYPAEERDVSSIVVKEIFGSQCLKSK